MCLEIFLKIFSCLQDTILVIPQYPHWIEEEPNDVPLEACWCARPQLLFTCYLCPKGKKAPKNPTNRYCPDDICYHLVFFSTLKELKLPIRLSWFMECAEVTKLYEPSPTLCLDVAPAACMVGRVPLMAVWTWQASPPEP